MLLSIIENKSSELCLNRTSVLTKSRPSNRVVAIRKWPSDTASTLSLHRLSLSSAMTHVTSMDATESVCVYSMRTKANTVNISSIHNYGTINMQDENLCRLSFVSDVAYCPRGTRIEW